MKTPTVPRSLLVTACAVALVLLAACSSSDQKRPPAIGSSESSSGPRVLNILVTNDDGATAPGIDALVEALRAVPDVKVTVVAPAQNQSGTGNKSTPGGVTATDTKTMSGYPAVAVDGYPVDSVEYALKTVFTTPPDVVISGINAGQNIGPAITLSGTVGAAMDGARHGIPALAVSSGLPEPYDFATAAKDVVQWLSDHRTELSNPHGAPMTIDNLNVPTCTAGKVRGLVATTPDTAADLGQALKPADCTSTVPAPSTDVAAFDVGFATLSHVAITAG